MIVASKKLIGQQAPVFTMPIPDRRSRYDGNGPKRYGLARAVLTPPFGDGPVPQSAARRW